MTPSGPCSQAFPVNVSRKVSDSGLTLTGTWQGTIVVNGYW
jgi:hypothetical protein